MDSENRFINIKEVHIKNFRGYGENPLTDHKYYSFYELDKSIVVFNGYNGYGKTSFFEAIEWCITDTVLRLNVLKDVYDSSFLKKSHYLKFYSSIDNETQRNQRIVSVIIKFDNGIMIRRETKINFLKVTQSDRYSSKLDIFKGEEKYENCPNSKISELVFDRIYLNNNLNLLNINLLGQESMNRFIRSTGASDRKKTLMQLLNFEDIQDIIDKSSRIVNSRTLINKQNYHSNIIDSYNKSIEKLNEVFTKSGLGSLGEYVSSLNQKLNEIKILTNSWSGPNIIDINNIVDFNTNNSIKQINSFKIIQQGLILSIKNAKENELKLKESKEKIDIIKQINHVIACNNMLANLNLLKDINYEQLKKSKIERSYSYNELKELEKILISLDEELSILIESLYTDQSSEMSRSFFTSFSNIFNKPKLTINSEFWNEVNKKYINYISIIDKFKKYAGDNEENRQLLIRELQNVSFFNQANEKYLELCSQLISVRNDISSRKTILDTVKKNNTEQSKLLESAKKYIISNNDLNACPVCQNNDFSKEKYVSFNKKYAQKNTIAESLLNIIDLSIASGNEHIGLILSELTDKMRQEETLKSKMLDNVFEPILNHFKLICTTLINELSEAKKNINNQLANTINSLELLSKELSNLDLTLKRFEESYKQAFNATSIQQDEHINTCIIELINTKTIELSKHINSIKEKLKLPFSPTFEDLVQLNNKLNIEPELNKYYPSNLENLESVMQNLKNYIDLSDKIKCLIEEIVKLDLPMEYEEIFKNITVYAKNAEIAKREQVIISSYIKNASSIFENTQALEKSLFENLSSNSTLIEWIYKQINPHPYYRDLRIVLDEEGGVLFKGIGNKILYDHIFSAAQLNILALSIFLGLGIPQNYTKLGQLLLDDPIQNMDDANILALIDVMRAILDSNTNRKLIISTHDDDFAQLLSIKMRNKDFIQYNFTGYGVEGPYFNIQ